MAEGCGERIGLASVPGGNFTCERWSPIGTFISSIDFARAMIWWFHLMSVPGEHFLGNGGLSLVLLAFRFVWFHF
jgi:hypothetical protein